MCFVSCKDLDSAKKFKSCLNEALADSGGVFWDDVKDNQLQCLLKDMTQKYFLNDGMIKKAVLNVGRQPFQTIQNHKPEDDTYVFNEKVQVIIKFYEQLNNMIMMVTI